MIPVLLIPSCPDDGDDDDDDDDDNDDNDDHGLDSSGMINGSI